ncbi:MAG: ABC transporter permease subunit [Ruminococcus flavefaciens]|nr:ABC transporter permease subunit [Ruminococcus flavefaciens]MCM1058753.1 ABC transporter permease subunit [Eubacterium sp.]
MINMIKADLYRITKGIGLYVAIIAMILTTTISVCIKEPGYIGNTQVSISEEDMETISEASEAGVVEVIENFRTERDAQQKKGFVREILGANINLYYMMIILVFVILMADFSNKTIKNTITSAYSKKKYFISKISMIYISAIIFITLSNLFAYMLNFIINEKEYTEPIKNTLEVTLYQLPMLLGIVSLLIFFGFLFKKSALFNAVAISFVMLFQIIMATLCSLTESEALSEFMSKYELQSALKMLSTLPDTKYILTCAAIGFAEIIVFSVLGYAVFKKSEIK